ncbi:uncharacterized protein LOC144096987 [Amblyomma americanum]
MLACHAPALMVALLLVGARGFSFGGQRGEDVVEEPLIEEEDEDEDEDVRPNKTPPDMPPWYSSKGFPYDYGMGDELSHMFGPDTEDLFKEKDFFYEEPKKTFEEIYEELFRFHDVDKDDALSPEEVRRALIHSKIDILDAEGNDMVDDALGEDDKDKDGMLSLEEFLLSQKTNTSGLKSLGSFEL